jgi:uncharacterized protein
MKASRIIGFLLIGLVWVLSVGMVSAQDTTIPRPVGDIYVQDFAQVLSESEKAEIRSLGRALEDKTTAQIAVLTVDSTGDQPIQEFSNTAFRQFGIGSESADNGVLIVLAMSDRKVWIEVGYGLEGKLPDGKVGRILNEYTVPYLKNQQPNLAIDQTYRILTKEVLSEYGLDESQLTRGSQPTQPTQPQPTQPAGGSGGIPSWLFIIIAVIVLFLDFKFFGGFLTHMLLSIVLRSGGRGGGAGGGGFRGGGGGSSGGGGAGRGW